MATELKQEGEKLINAAPDSAAPDSEKRKAAQSQAAQSEDARRKVINRLKRLEGQVRGLQRMVDEERSCHEILTLISGVRRALDAAGDEVLSTYLNDCQDGLKSGSVDTTAIIDAVKLARG